MNTYSQQHQIGNVILDVVYSEITQRNMPVYNTYTMQQNQIEKVLDLLMHDRFYLTASNVIQ